MYQKSLESVNFWLSYWNNKKGAVYCEHRVHWLYTVYTVSQKNDTDVAGYVFNAHQLILIVFGR